MYILSINSGSSSIKFQLFTRKNLQLIIKGQIDAIGLPTSSLTVTSFTSTTKKDFNKKIKISNHHQAIELIFQELSIQKTISSLSEIEAIGHRFVHGGTFFSSPAKINRSNLPLLKKLIPLAPLHNPHNYAGLLACQKLMPKTPQVAVFDTAFHQTMPPKSYTYALPDKVLKQFPLRKFGFHGTNHQYISSEAIKILKKSGHRHANIVTCHLGNGISLTAVKNGKSIDTTMGYTPLEGPVMGTRSGSIDPAVPLLLCQKLKKTPEEILEILNFESGLKALSGISSDFRPIRHAAARGHKRALFTMELLTYQLAKLIGSMAAALNGLDAIVFSGGIGENAIHLRHQLCSHLTFLGVRISPAKNLDSLANITGPTGKVQLLIIPANEEKGIAQQTLALL